jgi:hypothetical protein
MSNRISLVQGTTKKLSIDLVDQDGRPIKMSKLVGATAQFLMRVQPTDLVDVLKFTTADNPTSLYFDIDEPVLHLVFAPADTALLPLQLYFYQVQLTQTDASVVNAIDWDLLDLNLGGSAVPTPPPFENTVPINHDYPLPGTMTYMTPGGSPIENAQVRLYYKSDYDAGNLAAPLGITTTDAHGNWKNTLLVLTGFTYTVRLEKAYEFGPDTREFFA